MSCKNYIDGCTCKTCMIRHNSAMDKAKSGVPGGGVAWHRIASLKANGMGTDELVNGMPGFRFFPPKHPGSAPVMEARQAVSVDTKLPPMNCKKCNHYNEYVGPEHLVAGAYVCRSCR